MSIYSKGVEKMIKIFKSLIELVKNFIREEELKYMEIEDKRFELQQSKARTQPNHYIVEKEADISGYIFMKTISIANAMILLRNLHEAGYTHIKDESYMTDFSGKHDYDDVGNSGELEIVTKFVAISYKKPS